MTGRVAKVLAMLNALSDEEKRELLAAMNKPEEPDAGVRQPTPPLLPGLGPQTAFAETTELAP